MIWLTVMLVLAAVASFIFSIYTYFKTESKKGMEAANVATQKERIRNTLGSLRAILHSTDSIVQIPKQREVKVQELQDLARVTRAQVYILMNQLKHQHESLESWTFGRLVPSVGVGAADLDIKEPDAQPGHNEHK
jgi:hypothetical protein